MFNLDLVIVIASLCVIGFLLYMLVNLWLFGSSKKINSLHENRSFLDIVKGNLYKSFSDERSSEIIAGIRLKKQKDGKLKIRPTGTYSNQAIYKTLKK